MTETTMITMPGDTEFSCIGGVNIKYRTTISMIRERITETMNGQRDNRRQLREVKMETTTTTTEMTMV